MKEKVLIVVFLFISQFIGAQHNIRDIFMELKQNNIQLKALQDKYEAKKIGNKTGIFLDDPEIGGGYLWGSPTDIGNRIDFSISQSFDFPSAYKIRNKIAALQDNQLNMEFLQAEFSVYMEAIRLIVEIRDIHRKVDLLKSREEHFKIIADSYQVKLDNGDATIFDLDRASLNLLKIQKEINHLDIYNQSIFQKLKILNGNKDFPNNPTSISVVELPEDFEEWFIQVSGKNPELLKAHSELAISHQNQKLVSAESLPSFEAGFMSENVEGEQYNGVTLGLSVPLWENKNRKKLAAAQSNALAKEIETNKNLLRLHFELIFIEISRKQESLKKYQKNLRSFDRRNLLAESLEAGQITLIEYFLELSNYYENEDLIIEMERELDESIFEIMLYNY